MRQCFAVFALVGVVVLGTAGPAAGDPSEQVREGSTAQFEPRSYVEDEDTFFDFFTRSSHSNCGGNPACDIAFTSFSVTRNAPDDLYVIVGMSGLTDSEMSNSENGAMIVYIDSDATRSGYEFGMWTRRMTYPTGEAFSSWVYSQKGESWEPTDVAGLWLRSDRGWGASIPWKDLGIRSARFVVRAGDAAGQYDFAPAEGLTPVIPVAALVEGAPGQPTDVVATSGTGQVTLAWQAPKSTGTSPITLYTVSATPGGATCTTTSTSCTVTGLTGGTGYAFSVTATNARGTGPASDVVSATPLAAVLQAPTGLKASYSIKGKKGMATVAFVKPAGATSMQARWALNGGRWTAWRPVSGSSVRIGGLVMGKTTSLELRGLNANGPGVPAGIRLSIR